MKNVDPWFFKYLGLKWKEDFHCWDLVKMIYADQFGLDVSTDLDCIKHPLCVKDASIAINEGLKNWTEVEKPREFDLCIIGRKEVPHHVGIVINDNTIFHVAQGSVSCATFIRPNLFANYKLIKFYRHAKNL